MAIEVEILGKFKEAYGIDVEVGYTCPHCGEHVTETICFSDDLNNCIAAVDRHECPECGEENDLEVDLY